MQQHEDVRHPSMNLGQAVAVCLYELVRQTGVHVGTGVPAAAEAGEVERLTALLTEVLEQTGYTRRHPANCDEAQIRRLVLRMGVAASDAAGVDGNSAAGVVEVPRRCRRSGRISFGVDVLDVSFVEGAGWQVASGRQLQGCCCCSQRGLWRRGSNLQPQTMRRQRSSWTTTSIRWCITAVANVKFLEDGRFWYRDRGADGVTFVLVDPAKGTKAAGVRSSEAGGGVDSCDRRQEGIRCASSRDYGSCAGRWGPAPQL